MTRRPIIAIDGPAGCGKTTVGRLVAQRLGCAWLDTGGMYRAIALKAIRAGVDLSDGAALTSLAERTEFALRSEAGDSLLLTDGEDVCSLLDSPEVDDGSSRVAVVPGVRAALARAQRAMGAQGGLVAAGRDMQTVVFPDADLKVFLRASPLVRARRRALQRGPAPPQEELDRIAAEIAERDLRDSTRAVSPLRPAPDAVVIDTDPLSAGQVADRIVALLQERHA